jgi:hypothetical protein
MIIHARIKYECMKAKNVRKFRIQKRNLPKTISELIEMHFLSWSDPDHINKNLFLEAFEILGKKGANFLETGTSAYGIDSTRLFDLYCMAFGGTLTTIDISSAPKRFLGKSISPLTKFLIGDSVEIISKMKKKEFFDFIYLDSLDLDFRKPFDAINHGHREFLACKSLLKKGGILLIDDTPANLEFVEAQFKKKAIEFKKLTGYLPGKGSMVRKIVKDSSEWELVANEYMLLCKKVGD